MVSPFLVVILRFARKTATASAMRCVPEPATVRAAALGYVLCSMEPTSDSADIPRESLLPSVAFHS